MSTKGVCRWCRVGRFHGDGEKWYRDWHLCFDCAIICGLNVQHLVPSSERKYGNDNMVIFPRTAYKISVYKVNSKPLKFGSLGKTDSERMKELKNYYDEVLA